MLFLAFIFKRGDGYGGHAVLRSLIALQTPRRNLYTPVKSSFDAKLNLHILYTKLT